MSACHHALARLSTGTADTTNMDERADIKIHVRFKLSALWASLMFCYVYADYYQLYQPGHVLSMLRGMMGPFAATPGVLLALAPVVAIPALMIFLSLVLPASAARLLNIALAVIFTVIDIMTMIGSWSYYVFFNAIETALTLLILWYAVRWAAPMGMSKKS